MSTSQSTLFDRWSPEELNIWAESATQAAAWERRHWKPSIRRAFFGPGTFLDIEDRTPEGDLPPGWIYGRTLGNWRAIEIRRGALLALATLATTDEWYDEAADRASASPEASP